ncbi:hypothetical protein LMG26857_00372 [Achromobacter anxifer]|nr:hypothetical protein LMG26857_00372 [Achromobacter anxifer]
MTPRLFALTLLAMLAFAGNSLLCRLALKQTAIDPATFVAIRIGSGALFLDEPVTGILMASSALILLGIALVVLAKRPA